MTLKKNVYKLPVAVPPGETLAELLDFYKMSQKELAERMGRPLKLANEIIKGKSAITPETAIQLERVLGKEAAFWTNLESAYQEARVREEQEVELKEETKAALTYPYSEMARHGWVPETADSIEITKNLLSFFGVNSLNNIVERRLLEPVFYRISQKKKVSRPALEAWLRRGAIQAQEIPTRPFDKSVLEKKVPIIRKLHKEPPQKFLPKITSELADAGVAMVVNRSLTNVPVNGATRWLGGEKALVQLSIYGKSADIFWFSLFHEIGHVLLHGKRDFSIDISNGSESNSTLKEVEADEYSRNVLIPQDKFSDFIRRGEFNATTVSGFASRVDVHPGVVVGRLQHEKFIPYSALNSLKGKYEWVKA